MFTKAIHRRNASLAIQFSNRQAPDQRDQLTILPIKDLVHLKPENAFIWWHIREYEVAPVTWRIAAHKYARRYAKAFVVHDDCMVTALLHRCNLTFFRVNGVALDPNAQFLLQPSTTASKS
jgi:hypothetical protein